MKRALVCAALLLLASSAFAADTPDGWERMVLSIAPSYALCARFSRYDTRLHVYTDSPTDATAVCLGGDCSWIAPHAVSTISGPQTNSPLPAYIYVPRDAADRIHLKLMVESTNHGIHDRAFAEIPILRERDFKQRMQLLGVRVDEGFRVTLRVYGLDVPDDALVTTRIYDMESNQLIYTGVYGFQKFEHAPAVAMECDVRNVGWWVEGRDLRIEVESSSPDAPIYAFVSVTDNSTQRFTTITPD